MEDLLAQTHFRLAALGSATHVLHGVMITKAFITVAIIIGASVVATRYSRSKDLVSRQKIRYTSGLWLGDNSGLFGTLVVLWLPTLIFFAMLATGLLGSVQGAGIGTGVSLAAIYFGLTACLIAVTVTMTILMQKAKTADRVDKLTYISQIFVGSHSGLLRNLFLLWSPFIVMYILSGSLKGLAPYQNAMMGAAQGIGSSAKTLNNAFNPLYDALHRGSG